MPILGQTVKIVSYLKYTSQTDQFLKAYTEDQT